MATKKLSKSEIKKKKCAYPDPPDEGLPIWMGTFADMMTLLFAFFVLLFSMSTLDPVKYSAFQNAQTDQIGGKTKEQNTGMPMKSQVEIKQDLQAINSEDLVEQIKEKMKEAIDADDSKSADSKTKEKNKIDDMDEPIKVSHDPRGVALEINGEICFGSGSIDLEEGIKELLKEVVGLMKNPDDNRGILVEGHTDSLALTGKYKEQYKNNRVLSSLRASEVVTYLEELGVSKNRLVSVGYADQWPVDVTWSEIRSGDVLKKGLINKYNRTTYTDEAQTQVKYSAEENQKRNRRIKIIFATK